jgi:hypothetical protein
MGKTCRGPPAFRRSRLARPRTASARSTQSRIDPPAPGTPRWVPRRSRSLRRRRHRAAPPGSAMTTPHRHGRSRRRRQRTWRPPSGRGGSTASRTGSTTDGSQSTIGPVARLPIDVPDPVIRRARPRHQMPLGRHVPTPPGQRSRSRLCATRCKRATHRQMLVEPSPTATSGVLHAQQRGGLAAQPVPHRPGRSRTRLPARRAAG